MNILALDTSSRAGSLALLQEGRIVGQLVGDTSLSHGQRLPVDIRRLLDTHRLSTADIDLYAVAAGPGSFTGLRVGIATVQGLALVHRRRIVPISTLEALGYGALIHQRDIRDGDFVAAWVDAQRGEIFSALYKYVAAPASSSELERNARECEAAANSTWPAGDRFEAVEEAAVDRPIATLARWRDLLNGMRVWFTGDGALRYRDVFSPDRSDAWRVVEPPPLAAVIAHLAVSRSREVVSPHHVKPIYVRRPDAELARDRQRGGTGPEPADQQTTKTTS